MVPRLHCVVGGVAALIENGRDQLLGQGVAHLTQAWRVQLLAGQAEEVGEISAIRDVAIAFGADEQPEVGIAVEFGERGLAGEIARTIHRSSGHRRQERGLPQS